MKLYYISTGLLHVNTYFLVNENTNKAIVIDSGENYDIIKKMENDYHFKITALLLTHAHFDHAGIAKKLQDNGVKVYLSELETPKLFNKDNLSENFGKKFESFVPDYTFKDNDEIKIEDITIRILITSGHTNGSACFIVEDMLFSGDTLFKGCVGRTDFPTGSFNDMKKSINRLFSLIGDYKVYPGHNEFTTLNFERKNNIMVNYD